MPIAEIEHQGYRSPATDHRYLPPGRYTVGNHLDVAACIVPDELARYLVETGQATVTQEKPDIAEILVHCDRCGKEVFGLDVEGFTSGFYRVAEGIWSQYANPGEAVLCDACMQSDPRYLADYPPAGQSEEERIMAQWTDEQRRDVKLDYLNTMTVDELRAFAVRHGIDVPAAYMKKADLIELIASAAVQPDLKDQAQTDLPGE